ncbi:acetylornithine deacetylase [Marinobacter sp. OP 3.4]|uniref:acetylornithine deacetylase n=1 Tax=Marinobacter sp. OP 3.4 TaxID=3076501 RepID=UPI002E1C3EA1
MKKLLSLIVILALVAWGSYKGAVWWLADQTLNELRRSLSDHGALERGDISSAVGGDLVFIGTRFQSFQLTQPLDIQRLTYRAGSPLALLASLYGQHDLPRSWRLDVAGWRLPLDAAMLRNWVTDTDEQAPRPLFVPVCGPDARQQLGSGDLIRMGITELAGDAQLRQTSGGVRLELFTRESGSLEISWDNARLRLDNDGVNLNPGPENVEVILRDGGLMRRVTAYCARETGMSESAWADRVMDAFSEGLASRGLEASPQLLALYRQWLTEGGELALTLEPSSGWQGLPVRETGTGEGSDEDDAEEAGTTTDDASMTVTYNGSAVPDVYLSPVTPVTPEVPEQAMEPVVDPDLTEVVAGWQQVILDEAEPWLGYTVRVTLSNGRTVEGRLTRVDEDEVEVARPVDGGEVAYPMVRRLVERLEVWRRGSQSGE